MIWVGLTGGIASGKSTVAQILREWGYPVLDADQIARQALGPESDIYPKVVQHFGREILNPDASINRRELGRKVFQDLSAKEKLESIIHPYVREVAESSRIRLEQQGHKFGFYEIPLLFEKNLEVHFDCIVVVSSPEDIQKDRMKERDALTDSEIDDRLRNQIAISEKRERADFVIENNSSIADLKLQVQNCLKFIDQNHQPHE